MPPMEPHGRTQHHYFKTAYYVGHHVRFCGKRTPTERQNPEHNTEAPAGGAFSPAQQPASRDTGHHPVGVPCSSSGSGAGASARFVPWKVTPPQPRVSEASGATSLWPQWTVFCGSWRVWALAGCQPVAALADDSRIGRPRSRASGLRARARRPGRPRQLAHRALRN